jgi:hypothetical protein
MAARAECGRTVIWFAGLNRSPSEGGEDSLASLMLETKASVPQFDGT